MRPRAMSLNQLSMSSFAFRLTVAWGLVGSLCAAAQATLAAASQAADVDLIAGALIEFNDNGGWSWFQDERAIVDLAGGKILVSSVANGAGPGGKRRDGDVDVAALSLASGEASRCTLNSPRDDNTGWADDHNSAALWRRPDGRYLAMYSRHSRDALSRHRVSARPGEAGEWSPEQAFDNGAMATYSNLHYLAGDNGGAGRLYNFTRTSNFNPNALISNDYGGGWNYGGRLLTQGEGRQRPYVRYCSDGRRIHFIATEQHPRNYDNSVYHGYVQDGKLYDSAGTLLDENLFDGDAPAPADLTCVFAAGTQISGAPMHRAWVIDLEVDGRGRPYAVFQARAGDSDRDHRYFYARYDGKQWRVRPLAKAGGYLYANENDYTGLAALDPNDPRRLVISANIDPRSDAVTQRYELYRGTTSDDGQTWAWTPITFGSTVDNLRPLMPRGDDRLAPLLWMRGRYTTYTHYNTRIVGLVDIESLPSASSAASRPRAPVRQGIAMDGKRSAPAAVVGRR